MEFETYCDRLKRDVLLIRGRWGVWYAVRNVLLYCTPALGDAEECSEREDCTAVHSVTSYVISQLRRARTRRGVLCRVVT